MIMTMKIKCERLFVLKVIEWQKKLEDIRLRELRSRRNADRWAKEVEHLRSVYVTTGKTHIYVIQ